MSKREDSATLYLYVKQHILKLLISGKYPADSQLPTEYQLMKDLNVGRATVRAALSQLEEEGTIYKRQGVGTFVSKKDPRFKFEPFISLSFMLRILGIELSKKIVEQEDFITTGESGVVPKGIEYKRIKRVMYQEDAAIIIDHNLVSLEDFEEIKTSFNCDTESLFHLMLEKYGNDVTTIKTVSITREPTLEDCKLLKIGVDEELLQTTRAIYIKNSEKPIMVQRIIVPNHILELPLFLT